jgi:hypothetical protein
VMTPEEVGIRLLRSLVQRLTSLFPQFPFNLNCLFYAGPEASPAAPVLFQCLLSLPVLVGHVFLGPTDLSWASVSPSQHFQVDILLSLLHP